jgi:BlaI family penicillinase repressor
MGNTKYIKPTESELEILRILWERNTASVREVHEELS